MDEDLKKEVAGVMGSIKEFKDTHEENLKKSDALNEQKMNKMQDSILEKLEKMDTAQAQDSKRLEQVEAFANRQEKAVGDKGEAKERTQKFNDFLRKASHDQNNQTFDILDTKGLELKQMSSDVQPEGGYLVRPEFADFVIGRVFETSPMRRIANIETIGSRSLEIDIDDNEAGAGWVGENETRSETTTPEVGMLEIVAREMHATPIATTQVIEDAHMDLEGWLQRKVSERFGRLENTAFITGDNVKKPRGILDYDAWAVAETYERNKLEQISSGAATTLTADGLISLQNSLVELYQSNATWLMRRATYGVAMKLKDGQGQYLFNASLDQNTGLPSIDLLGRPVMFAADMPALGAGALSVAYGDFRVGYTIVDRRGIQILRDPFTTKGKVKFYTTKRVGGAVTSFDSIKIGVTEA